MRMTFDEAVEFILNQLETPANEQRAMRDKVRKRVTYALGKGHLPRLDINTQDVDRDELIHWARTKWRGKFDIPINVSGLLSDTADFRGTPDHLLLPATIEACHASIQQLASSNRLLVMMVNRQAAVISDLRPLADQYERNRAKNRASARKPRDGGA